MVNEGVLTSKDTYRTTGLVLDRFAGVWLGPRTSWLTGEEKVVGEQQSQGALV